jgi:tetratricopeptide (TPR) repeat protein
MRTLLRSILLAAVVAAPLAAQERPALPRNADPNDWESYFDLGERAFPDRPNQANAAFVWAARLDPTRAEPLAARWATFYAADQGLWINYLNDEPETLRREAVIANEDHMWLAFVRNPFVHRGLEVALLARLGRRLLWDRATDAFMEYGRGEFDDAAREFGRLVRGNPERNYRLRHYRALSFVGGGQLDSAVVEIEALLATLRERESREVGRRYESKAAWENALGMVHEARRDTAQARRAFERSLVEDLSWFPARMGLARLEMRAGNAAAAAEQLAQAVELSPRDGVVRLEYGNALAAARRNDEALAQYQAALELEPYWAEAYFRVARAHDVLGQTARAAPLYRQYLERAPRSQSQGIQMVARRLAEIEAR